MREKERERKREREREEERKGHLIDPEVTVKTVTIML